MNTGELQSVKISSSIKFENFSPYTLNTVALKLAS